jgi:hypothetical protein
MANLEELDEPTPDEQARINTATDAISNADELAVVPMIDSETDERELFLVAVRHVDDDDASEMQPIGRLCDLNEVADRFSVPEPLAAE